MEELEQAPCKVLLLAADYGRWDAQRSLDELAALAESAGYEVAGVLCQKRDAPDNAAYLGEGRLEEARLTAENLGVSLCIFDDELTGVQLKNTERAIEKPVIDRTMLILEIFEKRAVTSEGKYQTELARLRYRLPRLIGLGPELSRQGGGGGGGAGARRGAGESKLEYDRRYLRERITQLQKKLEELEKRRAQTRKSRRKNGVPVVALVGYTNVGKSSLLNRLCKSEVLAQDMLFATLDPTARQYTLENGLEIILIDTVGFVSRLPHHLVEAFKSTLEEAKYADLILKVCDAGDPQAETQLRVTDEVLKSLGCEELPQLTVYNKCDMLRGVLFDKEAVAVSAKTGQGLDELMRRVQAVLNGRMRPVKVLLPYEKAPLAAALRTSGRVTAEEYRPDGIYIEGLARVEDAYQFEPYGLKE